MNLDQASQLTEEEARKLIESIRWPEGPVCPDCSSKDIAELNERPGLRRCRPCRRKFTVTVGTIFEDSHLPLRKWIIAFSLMTSSKKGVSALQLTRNLGIARKTGWFVAHRIRHAMKVGTFTKLRGKCEVDEVYIGGRSRKGIRGRGSERKVPVMTLVERDGRVKARVVERVNAATLKGAIRELVDKRSTIFTDEMSSYTGIGKEFYGGHKVVRHNIGQYVKGDASTNTAESWHALLKRGVHGIFHHVSKKHLERYLDEFSFRWNHRRISDAERMLVALTQAEGRRLSYNPLIANEPA